MTSAKLRVQSSTALLCIAACQVHVESVLLAQVNKMPSMGRDALDNGLGFEDLVDEEEITAAPGRALLPPGMVGLRNLGGCSTHDRAPVPSTACA